MRGRLIVIEGLDGTGKSTLARLLAADLGATCLASPSAELRALRSGLDAVLEQTPRARQLFYAATVMHVSERAEPLLRSGLDVVVDRYLLSTLAYAELRGRALDLDDVCSQLAIPDFTLFLDCDDRLRAHRITRRGRETDEDRRSLLEGARLRRTYGRLLNHHPLTGVVLRLDASRHPAALSRLAAEACRPAQQQLGLPARRDSGPLKLRASVR